MKRFKLNNEFTLLVNKGMSTSLKIKAQDNSETMFIRISGIVLHEYLYQLEDSLHDIENTKTHKIFVFDFTHMEEIPAVAISIIVLMQMEARKKGQVYTLAPKNHLRTVFLKAGAIREAELLPSYLNSKQAGEDKMTLMFYE